MKKARFSLLLTFCIACLTHAQQPSSLLFHLSGEDGVVADFARGSGEPHYLSQISVIDDGAAGKALRCGYKQLLTWRAPGNIYAREGTLAFFWRAVEPVTPTEFPIFRVSFADHSSWDMTWLRIDYNGNGFDAFVTDNNLARGRVSTKVDPLPDPAEWVHFAFSWDETRGIRFYLNGRELARRDTTLTLNTGLDQFGPHSRIISPYKVQSMYNMVRGGDIDELCIYDKMLSASEIANLASGQVPQPAQTRPDGAAQAWRRFYGFDGATPPELTDEHTIVRKLGITDIYDLKRWYWKAGDGIRETTWPGVYNRSRIEGRNDYFQLPDWDCYSTSGQQVRWHFARPDDAQKLAILVTHPDPGHLEIEFYNTARRAMKVRLEGVEAPRGKVLAQTETPAIQAPSDLVPKTARVVLKVPQGCRLDACHVVLNPGREQEEIYPANNITSCRLQALRAQPE